MICPNCKNDDFGNLENSGAEFKICKECGYVIQTKQSDEYDKLCEEQQKIREQTNTKPIITCPYCKSTTVSKITNTKKAIKIGLFGIFGAMDDAGKTWKCNGCGSKW